MNTIASCIALILTAQEGEQASSGGFLNIIVMFALIFLVFQFVLFGPQKKEEKKKEAMRKALKKGDTVVTTGGIIGAVTKLNEKTVILEVDKKAHIEFLRSAIREKLSGDAGEAAEEKKG